MNTVRRYESTDTGTMLTLRNIHSVTGDITNIAILNGKISNVFSSTDSHAEGDNQLYFDEAIVFPGLINSHDHLDFNLFPRLGNRIYNNYVEWGSDIHRQNKDVIDSVLKIPKSLRTQWGIFKNLLNGVTTVFNHGENLQIENSLIDVFQDKNALHSIALEKNWRWKLNDPFNKKGFYVIHIGEGTDDLSHKEIDTLLKWNMLHKKLIGIHGVAMDPKQAASFAALVWCPDSNFFLLGATATVDKLKKIVPIVFGTDSTVSADWNIWKQLRLARGTCLLNDHELFASVTTGAARLRGLESIGTIGEGTNADLVIAKKKSSDTIDAFFLLNPEDILVVIKDGEILLFDESLATQLVSRKIKTTCFCRININNSFKLVKGDLANLVRQIKVYAADVLIPVEPA